jgi:S1-C subfamily serine protease
VKLAGRVKLQAETGVMIADVVAGSPAEQAGFAKADSHITIDGTQYAFGGDIVTAIDGEPVRTVEDLRRILAAHKPGDTIQVQVVHADGGAETLDVTLGERPQAGSQTPPTSTLPGGFEIPGGFPEGG